MKNKIKNSMRKIWKNKTFRTFFQAFIGSVVAIAPTIDFSASDEVLIASIITLIISSVSAGTCAVMNIGKMESI